MTAYLRGSRLENPSLLPEERQAKGRNASHSSRTLLSRPLRKAEDALRLGM